MEINRIPHPTDTVQVGIADFGYFYVGGEYVETSGGTVRSGAMYVEYFRAADRTSDLPVVMVHGNWQTGNNFTGTPDGRRGWAHDFLRAGYDVYVIDQAGRGRSGNSGGLHGQRLGKPVGFVTARFTSPATDPKWPQAAHHTQWPGSGQPGDPVFDRHYASQVESLTDRTRTEELNLAANLALTREIGPAIWLTHSQSGPFGIALASAAPDKVVALLSIEPGSPPFFEVNFSGGDDWWSYADHAIRPWGPCAAPLAFEPPVNGPEDLEIRLQPVPDSDAVVPCYLQAEPARQLPHMADLKMAIVVGEASYHAPYDHCTAAFLHQAGVPAELIRLEEVGIRGNGHMMMIEQNNHEIADFLLAWLKGKGL